MDKLTVFKNNEKETPVNFLETQQVKSGVICDVYEFANDSSRDLGIVNVTRGSSTPKQKILKGKKTIEGYISGKGTLKVTRVNGEHHTYKFSNNNARGQVELYTGDIMQWEAEEDLSFYEICEPPYTEGRFQNLH